MCIRKSQVAEKNKDLNSKNKKGTDKQIFTVNQYYSTARSRSGERRTYAQKNKYLYAIVIIDA